MAKQTHSDDDAEQRRVLDHNAFIRMYLEFLICLTKEEASYFHGDEDARNLSLDRDTNLIEREKRIFSTYGENTRKEICSRLSDTTNSSLGCLSAHTDTNRKYHAISAVEKTLLSFGIIVMSKCSCAIHTASLYSMQRVLLK